MTPHLIGLVGVPGRVAIVVAALVPERFWSKAARTPNGCLTWTAALHEWGYGIYGVGTTTVRAHRVSYWLTFGPFDERKHVLHKCDNPPCIEPSHLYLGNDKDNARDRIERGRDSKPPRHAGEANRGAKLTLAQVGEVRKILATTSLSCAKVGAMFGLTKYPIQRIKNGKGWRV